MRITEPQILDAMSLFEVNELENNCDYFDCDNVTIRADDVINRSD